MKLVSFFVSLVILILCCSKSYAQGPQQDQSAGIIMRLFPDDTWQYVLQHSDTVVITEEYKKDHEDMFRKKYAYITRTNEFLAIEKLRTGDTILVYANTPYYSIPRGLFIDSPKNLKKPEAAQAEIAERKAARKQKLEKVLNSPIGQMAKGVVNEMAQQGIYKVLNQ